MSYLTKYGTQWGAIPQTAGAIFWVAPSATYTVDGRAYSASDDNDGLSPEKALLTIDRAWNVVTANSGEVIVLLPGTHSPSASIAADVAGVTMMGLPGGSGNWTYPRVTIAAVTGDQNINLTAADIEIAHVRFIPVTADSAIDLSAAADRAYIHHCSFDMATPAANTGTIGIDFIGGASNCLIDTCYFECDAAQGPAIVFGASLETTAQNLTLVLSGGTWLTSMSQAAAGRRLVVRDCDWIVGNGTITNGILGTASGEVSMAHFIRNTFADSVTKGIDGYDAGDAEIVENYQSGVGSADGGVLITATT
jgi:hypothetical protein